MDTPNRPRKTKALDVLLIVALVLGTSFVVIRTVWSGRHAPTPSVFSAGYNYSQAKRQSQESGKPVFVVASADWCGPCQMYKRGALSDESVRQAIEASFVPAHVNVDEQTDAAAELRVFSIPLTAIVQDGQVVARFEGVLGARELLELAAEFGADSSGGGHASAGGS